MIHLSDPETFIYKHFYTINNNRNFLQVRNKESEFNTCEFFS